MTSAKDPKRYYRIEAREILDGLSSELLALSRGESRPDAPARLFRLAHTLKGAATVVGEDDVVEMARILEDVLGAHRDSGKALSTQEVTEFLRMLEGLEAALSAANPAGKPVATIAGDDAGAATPSLESSETVRIDLQDLDGVTTSLASAELQASALLVTLRELDATTRSLSRLLEQQGLPSNDGRSELVMAHVHVKRQRDSMRDVIDRLTRARGAALARADSLSRGLRYVRERVGRLALVPAANAFPAIERAARLAASSTGKSIRLDVGGGDVRLDRHVLPIVSNALLHLVRNAVDHGIESPAARVSRSKPSEGRVTLRVERRGTRVAFVCEDDGAGIDTAEIRELAATRGLMSAEEARQLDDAAALRLLFRAGVSTRSKVTDLSGRGVGLDVVEAAASALNGEAVIASEVGLGTRVELIVPVSLSTATAVSLRVQDTSVFLPLDVVRSVARVPTNSFVTSPHGESILHAGELLPVLRLSAALGLGRGSCRGESTDSSALAMLILSVQSERFAVIADATTAIVDVVVRPLPWAAGRPLGVAGAALDVEGVSHLVLDPRGLMAILQRHAGVAPEPAPARHVRRSLPILVIDDSLTTRMLEQSILQTAGFEVDVATSAEEGLGMASARQYGLFVVDVEMPGMNGFEFTQTTRTDLRFQHIPVILVTSLSSEADQQKGRQAGAAAYVIKGQFDQDHFLNQVRTLSRAEE